MFDVKVLIKRLPSFSVPKITVIRHVKPILKLRQTWTVLWKNARTLKWLDYCGRWWGPLLLTVQSKFQMKYNEITNQKGMKMHHINVTLKDICTFPNCNFMVKSWWLEQHFTYQSEGMISCCPKTKKKVI